MHKKSSVQEADMPVLQQTHSTAPAPSSTGNTTYTTLYNVIQAVAQVMSPGEEKYISTVVMRLLRNNHARPATDFRDGPVQTKGSIRRLYLYKGGQT
jgi:hypothetical protein